jgi:hypothetical protein
MEIDLYDFRYGHEAVAFRTLIQAAPIHLPMNERVPTVEGNAFELKAWYGHWIATKQGRTAHDPTHLQVEAIDEFQATIPWSQLDEAVFLYAQEGKDLIKGYPLRLYVPHGSSECLHVKSVVKMWFLDAPDLGHEATYGFKNAISIEQLMQDSQKRK